MPKTVCGGVIVEWTLDYFPLYQVMFVEANPVVQRFTYHLATVNN